MELVTSSPDETLDVGRRLARMLQPDDVVLLSGRLGSGKTLLVSGLAEGLGVQEPVTSPSFVLVHEYDGFLQIVDRKKEMIKYKGYQVAPAELEALLLEHPAILDAAVIPKQADAAGEVPKAFVVLRPGVEASQEDLMSFIAERVAPYKKIRELEFVDSIPKSLSGKILRRELIERERGAGA